MATRGDPSFRTDLKRDGYSQEEKYFNELNRELIEQLRAKKNAGAAPRTGNEKPSEPPAPKSKLKRILKKIFGPTEVDPDIF